MLSMDEIFQEIEEPSSLSNSFVKRTSNDETAQVSVLSSARSVTKGNSVNDNLQPGTQLSNFNQSELDSIDLFDELMVSFDVDTPKPGTFSDVGNKPPSPPAKQQVDDNIKQADLIESFTEPMDIETWSRGKALTVNGNPIQPVQLFAPNPTEIAASRRSLTTSRLKDGSTPAIKKITLKAKDNQMTLYDLVGSQPIKRPVTAFIMFSKEIQPKINRENPGADPEMVSRLTAEKWKQLSDEEKDKYEKLCKEDLKRYGDQMNEAKNIAVRKLKEVRCPKEKSNIKQSTVPVGEDSVRGPIQSCEVPFSMNLLRKKLSYGYSYSQHGLPSKAQIVPIGVLQFNSGWVCHQGTRLLLLNPHRLDEVFIYQRLIESFQFQSQPLESPISINQRLLGGVSIWKTLLSLRLEKKERTAPYKCITDPRLMANGLDVVIFEDKDSSVTTVSRVQLRGVVSCIPTYGIGDLCEILENITSIGPSTSLMQSRPLKVVNYLKAEAVRMARKSPSFSSQEDIVELLDRTKKLKIYECLHEKPFIHEIYDLSSLPQSQDTLYENHLSGD